MRPFEYRDAKYELMVWLNTRFEAPEVVVPMAISHFSNNPHVLAVISSVTVKFNKNYGMDRVVGSPSYDELYFLGRYRLISKPTRRGK